MLLALVITLSFAPASLAQKSQKNCMKPLVRGVNVPCDAKQLSATSKYGVITYKAWYERKAGLIVVTAVSGDGNTFFSDVRVVKPEDLADALKVTVQTEETEIKAKPKEDDLDAMLYEEVSSTTQGTP